MPMTKLKFREESLRKIKNLNKNYSYNRNMKVNNKILEELKKIKNKKILFYYPLKMEIDVKKSLNILRRNNEIYIPFMEGESFKMVLFRLPLKNKKFGIFEAGNSLKKIDKIDIAIVPIIGVDKNLQRVGFGKGMYDRFFETLKKRPFTIFIQPEFCHTKEVICDSYDISCDILMTPKVRVINKRKK